jgi:hypothetical protein
MCLHAKADLRKIRRAPTLQKLVKLALKCESAEELGIAIRKKYERQQRQRQRQAEAEHLSRDH